MGRRDERQSTPRVPGRAVLTVPEETAGHDRGPGVAELAMAWQDAVAGAQLNPGDRLALGPRFGAMAGDVLDAFLADDPDLAGARRAGAALVEMHVVEADAMPRTAGVLGRALSRHVGHRPDGSTRTAAVIGAVAAGFAEAVRDRTRHEQEQITASAFAARVAAEEARWNSEARFGAVFADAAIGIAICDVGGAILEVNRSVCTMLGFEPDDLTSRTFWEFVHPDDDHDFWTRVGDVLTGAAEHVRLEKPLHRRDGTSIWTDVVVSLIRNPDGRPRYAVAMVDDVTQYRDLRARLTHQAHHDPLTGLANRAVFFERLEAALATDARIGLCYLDLDGFKTVNDTLGHDQGDVLLRTVAERLAERMSRAGHLVARMGGDEFVVLVDDADPDRLREVARTALDTARRPVRLAGHEITLSASAGVVQRDDAGPDAAALMKAADMTMYWAKKGGRDRFARFDAARYRADCGRAALSARMSEALEQGEFVVEYQPLVRLDDERVTGVEALVRWVLPSGEVLPPAEFIGLAEDNGLIVPLGRSVLRQACREAAGWRAADPGVCPVLSVNLAARQLHHPGLLTDVTRILDETDWPAHLLQLELTESDMMATTPESLATLRMLADTGVRIAIDDFGTGYSNLAYLRHLPVQTLKLAGPFVTRAPHDGVGTLTGPGCGRAPDDVDLALAELVIRLAHTLDMSVVAESVETDEQCRQLRSLGCDTAQGWHFAPAVAADRVPSLVRDGVGATSGSG